MDAIRVYTLIYSMLLFDRGRTGAVRVKSLKVGLVTICSATLEEKYRCK